MKEKKTALWRLFLLGAVLALLLVSCKSSPAHSVNIRDYLTLTDKNGNQITYGMTHDEVVQQFTTQTLNDTWETAHENLMLYFTSWIFNETPVLTQMQVEAQPHHPEPSWEMPQGLRIGSTKEEVLKALSLEAVAGDIIDLLFAQDPKYQGKMYQITEKELESLAPETPVYRMAFQFVEEKLHTIILGDLESMA